MTAAATAVAAAAAVVEYKIATLLGDQLHREQSHSESRSR